MLFQIDPATINPPGDPSTPIAEPERETTTATVAAAPRPDSPRQRPAPSVSGTATANFSAPLQTETAGPATTPDTLDRNGAARSGDAETATPPATPLSGDVAVAPRSNDSTPAPAPTVSVAASAAPPASRAPSGAARLDEISITADNEAEFDLDTGSLVFIGNAVMNSPEFRLAGDRITVGVTDAGDGIKGASAVGSVTVSVPSKGNRQGVSAKSAKADFNPADGSFTLTGWPEITSEGRREVAATAETKMILFTNGQIETVGETKPGIVVR